MEFKIPPEVRAKLLGKVPFSPNATIDFIPKLYDEVPEEYRPTYQMRSMTKSECDYIGRGLSKKTESTDLADIMRDATRKCCMGWTNLYDNGSGELIDWKAEAGGTGTDKSLWSAMPLNLITELFTYLTRISGLSSEPVLTKEEHAGL